MGSSPTDDISRGVGCDNNGVRRRALHNSHRVRQTLRLREGVGHRLSHFFVGTQRSGVCCTSGAATPPPTPLPQHQKQQHTHAAHGRSCPFARRFGMKACGGE